jgi:predicted transcriptional regulator
MSTTISKTSSTKTRSKIANTVKNHPGVDVTELRRQYKAERLAEYVTKVVDESPLLSSEQRERIAAILRGGDAA